MSSRVLQALRFPTLALLVLLSAACYGPAYHQTLAHGYSLFAMDNGTDVAFVRDGDHGVQFIVDPRVFAVGWDEQFFVIKQHPDPAFGPKDAIALNRTLMSLSETRFFILRVTDHQLFGPFDETSYSKQRTALGVTPALSFTLVLQDLQ